MSYEEYEEYEIYLCEVQNAIDFATPTRVITNVSFWFALYCYSSPTNQCVYILVCQFKPAII